MPGQAAAVTGTRGSWTFTRRAGWDDLPVILRLRFEVRDWLRSRGSAMWQDDAAGIRQLIAYLERGELRRICDQLAHGQVIAVYALTPRPDPDYWDAPGGDRGDAMYLGKVMASRSPAYGGLGEFIISRALAESRQAGKRWLRLNCWQDEDGARLRAWWERRGFTHVRTVTVPGRMSGALYQRETGERP